MSKLKNNKGITLVALIITIIVLLILAMVSISLVMNSGIIDKSKSAVDKYSKEEIGEQLKLAYSEYQMSQYTGTPIDIQAKLREIYGNDVTATLANGKCARRKLIPSRQAGSMPDVIWRMPSQTARHQSSGSCSAQPGRGVLSG